MQSLAPVLSIVLCCICFCQATRYPTIYYLNNYCGQSLTVYGDAIVRISRSYYFQTGSCSVTLASSSNKQLMASFRSYYMSSSYVYYTSCPYEFIQLGSQSNPALLGSSGYCKSSRPSDQYFLQYQGSFSYYTNNYYNSAPDVDLLVTEMVPSNTTGFCPAGYFDCMWRSTCIDYSLTCNGYDDCGNSRDEIYGCGFTFTVGAIGGLAAGVFFFFVFVVIISVVCYRRRYRVGYVQYN